MTWLPPPGVDSLQESIVSELRLVSSGPEAESGGQGSEHCPRHPHPQQDQQQRQGQRVEEVIELRELLWLHPHSVVTRHLRINQSEFSIQVT